MTGGDVFSGQPGWARIREFGTGGLIDPGCQVDCLGIDPLPPVDCLGFGG